MKELWNTTLNGLKNDYKGVVVKEVQLVSKNAKEMHAKIIFQSKHHLADLHNMIRALAINHKYPGFDKDLVAHKHTILDDTKNCLQKVYNKSMTAEWDEITVVELKSVEGGDGKKPPKMVEGGNTTKTNTTKTYKQSITATMSCTDIKTVMAEEKKAEEAFKKAFETEAGVTVTDTSLKKEGCSRRLEQGSRQLSDGAIKADFTYTTTGEAKTVKAADFKTSVNKELKAAGLPEAVKEVKPPTKAQEMETTTTEKPKSESTTKTASGAMKTHLVPVALGFLLFATAWC